MAETLDETPRITVDLTQMLAEVPSRLSRIESDLLHMKGDIGKLETGQEKLRAEIAGLRGDAAGEFKAVRGDMTGEFAAVRGELHAEFKFMLRIMLTLGALMVGGFSTLWVAISHIHSIP